MYDPLRDPYRDARRPLLLDLFCGAGGAAMGYYRAGFDIVGVDNRPQPRYPFIFVEADALEYCQVYGAGFDAIHASPPCQGYSVSRNNGYHQDAPLLIPATREALVSSGRPFIIENVVGARVALHHPYLICGASFGLGIRGLQLSRHRLFEASITLHVPSCTHTPGRTIGVYGHGTNQWHRDLHGDFSVAECRQAMGISWMPRHVLSQAIPPAYTQHIGRQLLAHCATQQSLRAAEVA